MAGVVTLGCSRDRRQRIRRVMAGVFVLVMMMDMRCISRFDHDCPMLMRHHLMQPLAGPMKHEHRQQREHHDARLQMRMS